MSVALPPPPDAEARRRVGEELAATLFVEAGAGSGKTTALVDRVVRLVAQGEVELGSIAAITFTEKAAAELRDRIRTALGLRLDAEGPGSFVAAWCQKAIDQLDGSAIGTLHSFAQRILMENPVEAGLPPRIEVLDEVGSDVEFDRRWLAFRDELFADPDLERSVLLLVASGVKLDALRSIALAFEQNWDLVEEQVPEVADEPPTVHELLEPALVALDAVCAQADHCTDHEDKLLERIQAIAVFVEELRACADDFEVLDLLEERDGKQPVFGKRRLGKGKCWPDKDALLDEQIAAVEALAAIRSSVAQAALHRIGAALRRFTIDGARARRRTGQLSFHDLLVLARAVVRDPDHGGAVRRRLHDRYRRILLDEFQDTDPIQIELAVRIAAAAPESEEAGSALWYEVDIAPGHLFVVGDPKQSIYRFRRADISLFLHARQVLGLERGALVELDANFRSTGEIIEWVNDTFGALMGAGEGVAEGLVETIASQPPYAGLRAVRAKATTGPSVSVMGREAMADVSAGDLRRAEAESVTACVARAIDERWTVAGDAKKPSGRRAKLGDIAVLIPSRSPLPYLERSLAEAGIPYRVESSSLVYSTRAVRDLLMLVRAIDDPTDELSIVSALRTPLLGCGDDDLFRFKRERGGHWNYVADQPESVPADDPVRIGLTYLAECHDRRRWLAPSELLDKVARDRRCFELGFAEGRPRDVWRRLRFVIDQARGWSDSTGGSLRQYLQWVVGQTQEGARVAEAVLPETDDDAVRIMTIHAAKGLEFPVTIVAGLSTAPGGRPAAADVVFPITGGVGYRVGGGVATDEYTEWKPIDEQMSFHERIRLLYVACTRASDHLVVSLFRRLRAGPPKSETNLTNAELLVDGMEDRLADLPDAVDDPTTSHRVARPAPPSAPLPFDEWEAERAEALRTASRPSTIAATALTDEGGLDADDEELQDGLEKRPRDMDQPPWLKGRYGSAVGRAVHGVLQTVDLATGDGVAEAVAAQCQAEAIPDRAGDVTKLVGYALGSSIVEEAAASPHWREVYACTPSAGGRLLEGYIDLLYRTAEGLVVVDYKTAGTNDPARLDERVEGYRLQGASYAISVARATGEPVVRVAFLFLTPGGAVEIDLADLDGVRAEVERLIEAGADRVLT